MGSDFNPAQLPTWVYWEGPEPNWMNVCRRSIFAHAPNVQWLSWEDFEGMWDRDRDLELHSLHVAHRADYIRIFLLERFGGLWIDADCLLLQSVMPFLEMLAEHDFVGYRNHRDKLANNFIAARPNSEVAAMFYQNVCDMIRADKPLYWTETGSKAFTAAAKKSGRLREFDGRTVEPICWSNQAALFERGTDEEHRANFDAGATAYMLANQMIIKHEEQHPEADLLANDTFFSFLRRQALVQGLPTAS